MNIRKFKWILAFAGAVAVVLLLRGFAFTSCLIPSTGMENSIFQGERILVNKWSYGLRVPFMSLFSYHRWCESPVRRQDIVVFNNPAGIRQPVIDRREIYISRCLGVPGDTLLVDSLFSVISPEARFNPDKKRLYSYPASKENLITSLMHTLSITNDGLMGSNDSTHVRSFSRYEYYLLEQAMNGKESFVQPLSNREDAEPNPLIVPGNWNRHRKNNRLTRITYPQVRLRRKLKLLLPMHLLQKLRHRLLKLLLLQQSNSLRRQVRLWGKTINGKVQTDAAFL